MTQRTLHASARGSVVEIDAENDLVKELSGHASAAGFGWGGSNRICYGLQDFIGRLQEA